MILIKLICFNIQVLIYCKIGGNRIDDNTQQHDPEGEHHADEAELWRKNQAPPMYFFEKDVAKHAEERIQFTP